MADASPSFVHKDELSWKLRDTLLDQLLLH